MSSFGGLSIAFSGLFANQRAMNVTSHNIANANTKGYTRQVMHMTAYKPQNLPGGLGTLGRGTDVTSVRQIRDKYLDIKYRGENSVLGQWESRYGVMQSLEGVFNEPSDSSIGKLVDGFYNAIQELSKNPESNTTRTLVRQNTIALTQGVNRMSLQLEQLQKDMNFEFDNTVNQINAYADQITKLNAIIYESELEGGIANDVRDQRNLILDELSKLVDVDYYEESATPDAPGRLHVVLGGHELVNHFRASSLVTSPRTTKLNETDADYLFDIKWDDGDPLNITDGSLKGLMTIRDNSTGDLKGIPYYVQKLNDFVDTLSSEMNRIHSDGFGLDGTTGHEFFTIDGMTTSEFHNYLKTEGLNGGAGINVTSSVLDGTAGLDEDAKLAKMKENMDKVIANNPQYAGKTIKKVGAEFLVVDKIEAKDLSINKDLEDLNKLAASSDSSDIPGGAGTMLKMVATRNDTQLYAWGSPEDFVKSLVSNLGVDAGEAKRIKENQEIMTNYFQGQRESTSGVSIDEEMTSMIKFQNAYNASARILNVMNEMLDLLVNRLGA